MLLDDWTKHYEVWMCGGAKKFAEIVVVKVQDFSDFSNPKRKHES